MALHVPESLMANEVVDHGRRRFLLATTSVVGGVGVVAAAVPFIKSWEPSARAKAAGAPVTADIGKIELGQKVDYAWRGLPVFVVRRTKDQLAVLPSLAPRLVDPNSEVDQQRSEERRVGKECRSRWSADHLKDKTEL